MRSFAVSVFVVVFLAFSSPEDDMNSLIDALYRADGETVFRSLTRDNQEALSMMVSMFRLAPGEVASQLRQELQVQLSSSEITCMNEEDLIGVIIDSPMFRNELPWPRDYISCTEYTMLGDTALVQVSIQGEDSVYSYPMVLQEGTWRIATSFFSKG